MESKGPRPAAAGDAATLHEAGSSLARFAGGFVTPPWFSSAVAVAIATQICTTAIALGGGHDQVLVLVAGLAFFAVVAGVQLLRFRRLNGVWIGGFASPVVLGTGAVASTSYAVALVAATWASFAGWWVLMALCSVAGGIAYALGGRRWLRTYRAEPAVHGRGESALWLAGLSLPVIAGLVLLVLGA